ncbi:MAG: hypothetical protein U0835_20120 [Isosphaeraceae bacterium]
MASEEGQDWESQINPKPYDAGRFQAERLRRLDTPSLMRELERARRARADLRLFQRKDRLFLNGFIASVQKELKERVAIEGVWDDRIEELPAALPAPYVDPEDVDPDAEIEPVLRLRVPEETEPDLAPPSSGFVPPPEESEPIPDFLLQPFEDKGGTPAARIAALPELPDEPTGEELPGFLFEGYVEDRPEKPRTVIGRKPLPGRNDDDESGPAPEFPEFLLRPVKEDAGPRSRQAAPPSGAERTLPEILLTPPVEPRGNRPKRTQTAAAAPEKPLSTADAFVLRVENPPERVGLFGSVAWAWRCVRDYIDSVQPPGKIDEWEP